MSSRHTTANHDPDRVITVFRSRLRADAADYPEHAARISALAQAMPGYVEHKVFVADDGERLTLVTFADDASHQAWAQHPEHRQAHAKGIEDYYEEYSIAVTGVRRSRFWRRPAVR